jgi:hypothetical protein
VKKKIEVKTGAGKRVNEFDVMGETEEKWWW